MKARFDGICIKCGDVIKGFQNHPDTTDEIGWTRKPRPDGLMRAAWHLRCESKQDDPETVKALRAKQDARTGEKSEYVPTTSNTVQRTMENGQMNGNGDFLSSMAFALLPHLEGKLSANIDGITERVDAELASIDGKLESMLDSHVKTIVVENRKTDNIIEVGTQHYGFDDLLELAQMRMDSYLYGEPGTGKSTATEYIAKALELPYGYISLTIQTSESRIVGYNDAQGNYVPTEFYKRYTEGGVFCIDEIDNASGNLLTSLNSALANGNGAFPCGQVKRHPDFICIATGNTTGFGHNPMFPERQVLSGAIRDRFVFMNWTYDEKLEKLIALAQDDNKARTAAWVTWIQSVRKYAQQYDPKLPVTPRASIKGAKLLNKFDIRKCADMLVFRGYDKDSIVRILKNNPLPVV